MVQVPDLSSASRIRSHSPWRFGFIRKQNDGGTSIQRDAPGSGFSWGGGLSLGSPYDEVRVWGRISLDRNKTLFCMAEAVLLIMVWRGLCWRWHSTDGHYCPSEWTDLRACACRDFSPSCSVCLQEVCWPHPHKIYSLSYPQPASLDSFLQRKLGNREEWKSLCFPGIFFFFFWEADEVLSNLWLDAYKCASLWANLIRKSSDSACELIRK